jgi:hypothetical protein
MGLAHADESKAHQVRPFAAKFRCYEPRLGRFVSAAYSCSQLIQLWTVKMVEKATAGH